MIWPCESTGFTTVISIEAGGEGGGKGLGDDPDPGLSSSVNFFCKTGLKNVLSVKYQEKNRFF